MVKNRQLHIITCFSPHFPSLSLHSLTIANHPNPSLFLARLEDNIKLMWGGEWEYMGTKGSTLSTGPFPGNNTITKVRRCS